MLKKKISLFWVLLLSACISAQVVPIAHGHAHNDYAHERPLFEALENGFTSIEIDVFLHGDSLVVAHNPTGLSSKPSIQSLYLDPIVKVIKQNGGNVYKGNKVPVIFMIDFKTGEGKTYAKLKEVLEHYANILTEYKRDSVIKQGPIQILISGNKPFNRLMAEKTSYATIDADVKMLSDSIFDPVITRYSDPWNKFFLWNGYNEMPEDELLKLKQMAQQAHAKHKDLRFYGIPDKPKVWQILLDAGVDWINTDKLKEFNAFMRKP